MKIITLNIWDLPLWFIRDRAVRIKRICNFLKSFNADIICLQESFDPDHRVKLNTFFRRIGYFISDESARYRRVFGMKMAVSGGLVIFSKFPIRKSRFSLFPRSLFSPIEYFSGKGMLASVVETPYGALQIANVHFYQKNLLSDEAIHFSQLNRVLNQLATYEPLPTILAGDFNEDNMLGNSKFLNRMSANHFLHPHTELLDPSYRNNNPYVAIWINKILHSKRIDYILHKGIDVLGLKLKRYEVLYSDPALSDHDPVVLVFDRK